MEACCELHENEASYVRDRSLYMEGGGEGKNKGGHMYK